MEREEAYNAKVQKIAVGTNQLVLGFYEESSKEETKELLSSIANPNCELYTTMMNISELYHVIQEKEYEAYLSNNCLRKEECSFKQFEDNKKDEFQKKFDLIYQKISSCIKIEKYCLGENFEKEYVKGYANHNIFSFTLAKFCEDSNIKNIL